MARHQFFIAGTESGAGKTLVASGLLTAANNRGLITVALKPVAVDCVQTDEGWRSKDAMLFQHKMTLDLPYQQINPVALPLALSPHIAAEQAGKRLLVSQLAGYCRGVLMQRSDLVLVEGVDGWRTPINTTETFAGLVKELNLPVILVVAIRPGCISHALLAAEAIARDGLRLVAWVANRLVEDMPGCEETVLSLKSLLRAPCLGDIPFLANPDCSDMSDYMVLEAIIS
ncbi:MAG: dethiobiotin synthase [Oceanicoccus sp.]